MLTAMRGVGHSLVCMARDAWRYIGCQMLEHTAPIVETGGFEGRLIGMLRDSGENINWREIQKTPRNRIINQRLSTLMICRHLLQVITSEY